MIEDVGKIKPKPNQQEEQIKAHALRYMGKIFTGVGHYDALEKLHEAFSPGSYDVDMVEEGYVTNTGRYVSRAEGHKINDEMVKRKIRKETEELKQKK